MPVFALVDCNNFYASCERAFDPTLEGRAVVVLSNNDGIVIARSNEAKKLGIAMGEPIFKIRGLIESGNVVVRSSNYALYGDMSARVMSVLADNAPAIEVYSIDESFLDLAGLIDPDGFSRTLRHAVRKWTGIPVSIGIATTKTLAKVANRLAKKSPRADGVLDLSRNPTWIDQALRKTDVGDVWGIGYRSVVKLATQGIGTAYDLSRAEDGWIKKQLGAVGLRTVMELRGVAVHTLETQPADKQTCCCSRSFGEATECFDDVRDAVVTYTSRAAEKIRADGLLTKVVQVFIMTDRFRKDDPQYSNSVSVELECPTAMTATIISAALRGLKMLWRDGFAYRKAGVVLLELVRPENVPRDLFSPPAPIRPVRLMEALDEANKRFGRGTVTFGQVQKSAPWQMRQGLKSPSYTTKWADLPKVRI